MAHTRRELLEELARRRGIDTGGGATPTLESLQGGSTAGGGSPPPSLEAIQAEQVAIKTPGIQDSARSLLRGATMGLSDVAGAAVASLPTAMKQLQVGYQGPTVGEAYSDIKETIDFEAEEASAAAPGVSELLEGVGTVGTIAGVGLPGATAAALKRGAARVGLGGAKGSSAARGATTKPHFTAAQVAAHNKGPGAVKTAASHAGYGAGGEVVTGGDDVVEAAVRGIVGGKIGGKLIDSLKQLAGNSAGGRWAAAKIARKITGSDKVGQMTYVGMHPSTRRALKKVLAALGGAQA